MSRAVIPDSSLIVSSDPAPSSIDIIVSSAERELSWSGVRPRQSRAFGLAPARSKCPTAIVFPVTVARCKGLRLSGPGALGSSPDRRSENNRSKSSVAMANDSGGVVCDGSSGT
jgi:hypothetical protein